MTYLAITHVPGYLPDAVDAETLLYDTAREAWQAHVEDVERMWDDCPDDANGALLDAHTQLHNLDQSQPGSISTATPCYEGDHDLGVVWEVMEVMEP